MNYVSIVVATDLEVHFSVLKKGVSQYFCLYSVCVCVCIYIYIYIYMCVYMCVYECVYKYVYIFMRPGCIEP